MKLLELHIESFGVHHDRQLHLTPGFQPIFGDNESGKSTLLELIRQLLYGFGHINPYAFDTGGRSMAASGLLELDDHRQLRFRRRKGRNNTLEGQFLDNDQEVNESTLAELLSGTTSEMYQQIFGFSLDELSAGQDGLTKAKLQQAIFGSGLGSLDRLTQLQKTIRSQRDALFLSSGRAQKPEINCLLRRIQELSHELRAACVRPQDYKQRRAERDALQVSSGQAAARRNELRREHARLQRLIKAFPLWCRWRDIDQQIAGLALPDTLPKTFAERHDQLQQRLAELEQQLETTTQEIDRLTAEDAASQPRPDVVAQEAVIRQLQQQLGRMESLQDELPELTRRADQQREQVTTLLAELDPAWDRKRLLEFQTSLADRAELESLIGEDQRWQRQQEKLTAERQRLDEEIGRSQAQLKLLGERVSLDAVQRLLNEQGTYQANLQACEELDEKLMRLEQQIASTRQSLNGPLQQTVSRPEELPVPLPETIDRFRQRFDTLRDRLARCEQALESATEARDEKVQALEAVGAEMSAPDRDELKKQRRRRDEGWDIVRRIYVLGQAADEQLSRWLDGPEASLPDAFEREMKKADDMADQRQEQASLVAQQEQLEREVEVHRRRVASETKKFESCQRELRELEQEWREIWQPSRVQPLPPEEMKHWLNSFHELVRLRDEERVLGRRRRDLRDQIDDFHEELAEALPDVEGDTGERLRVGGERLEKLRRDDADRHACHEQLSRLEAQRAHCQHELEACAAQRQQWEQRWQGWLEQRQLPTSWSVSVASKVIETALQVATAARDAEQTATRATQLQQQLDAFTQDVRQLCAALAAELSALPPLAAVQQLIECLDVAKRVEHETQARAQGLLQLQRQKSTLDDQCGKLRTEIAQLWQAAGVASQSELEKLVELVHQARQWQQERHNLSIEIATLRGNDDEQEFADALTATDQDALQTQIEDVASQLNEVEQEYEQLHQQLGAADAALAELDKEGQATRLAMELEGHRGDLALAVDRWAPLVIAEKLLERNMDRFEQQSQPALLAEAQRYLHRMTTERYGEIRRRAGGDGLPEVFDAQTDQWKTPDALSRGTREQLYLAIRLAYVRQYCEQAESLPVVMDDVLVNFDARRARSTLDVLREVSQSVQILFLTCHASTLDLLRQVAPDVAAVELGSTGTVGQHVSAT